MLPIVIRAWCAKCDAYLLLITNEDGHAADSVAMEWADTHVGQHPSARGEDPGQRVEWLDSAEDDE